MTQQILHPESLHQLRPGPGRLWSQICPPSLTDSHRNLATIISLIDSPAEVNVVSADQTNCLSVTLQQLHIRRNAVQPFWFSTQLKLHHHFCLFSFKVEEQMVPLKAAKQKVKTKCKNLNMCGSDS